MKTKQISMRILFTILLTTFATRGLAAEITDWIEATPLFLSPYGGGQYDTWTGHSAVLRIPIAGWPPAEYQPFILVIGGGPNTFNAFAHGVGDPTNQPPTAYSTIYNSQVSADESLSTWAAPDTGGSMPLACVFHASTIANGGIYVVGGANSLNAWIWTGAASRSITAVGQTDAIGRPYQKGKANVMFEETVPGNTYTAAGAFGETTSIPIYDPAWEAGGSGGFISNTALPIYQPLMRHAAVSVFGNIYVIGGVSRENIQPYDGSGNPNLGSQPVYEDRVWYCRPNPGGTINVGGSAGGWQTTTPLQPTGLAPDLGSRYDLAACVVNNRIYIFGGRNNLGVPQNGVFVADIMMDGSVGEWRELTSLPVALAEHQVVFTGDEFYITGGMNSGGQGVNSVYYATIEATGGSIPAAGQPGTWALLDPSLDHGVHDHESVYHSGSIYVLGGKYAGTHGSSAYRSIGPVPTVTPTQTETLPLIELEPDQILTYPNPGRESLTFAYQTSGWIEITIDIYQMTGERVATITDRQNGGAGQTLTTTWQAAGVAPGIYLCRIVIQDENGTVILNEKKKVALIK